MQMKPFSPPHGNPKKFCKIFVKQLTFAATSFMIYVYTDDRTERSEINSNKINKEERNMDNQELNLEQMEQVSGGKAVAGGVKNKPAPKAGYIVHQITDTDTVWSLHVKYGVSMDAIVAANPSIQDPRLIRTGYWLYIPKKLK